MSRTLTVSYIKNHGENSSRGVSGIAATWINFDGTGTISTRDSLNVSSLSDNGTGHYGVNFTNGMDNVNYALSGQASGGTTGILYCRNTVGDKTVSTVDIETLYPSNTSGSGAFTDQNSVDGVVNGDLA